MATPKKSYLEGESMTITYDIEDGYVGKSRPHSIKLPIPSFLIVIRLMKLWS
jgi:hypothetical protein